MTDTDRSEAPCPPPGRWDFRAAPLPDGSGKWGIYARYLGPEESVSSSLSDQPLQNYEARHQSPNAGSGWQGVADGHGAKIAQSPAHGSAAAEDPGSAPRYRGQTLAQVYIRNPCRVEACTRPKPHARTRWCTDTGYAQKAGAPKRDAPTNGRAAEAPENVTPQPILGRQAAARPTPPDPLRDVVEAEPDPEEVARRQRLERAIRSAPTSSRLMDRFDARRGR